MKYGLFILLVTLTYKSYSSVFDLAPETHWHCPGVFDALDERDCPAPAQSDHRNSSSVQQITAMDAEPNDYVSRIYECQANSVILKMKTNISLPQGNYQASYNRYSEIHRVTFDSGQLDVSKQSLIQSLAQLEQALGSNPVEYLDCNVIADVNSR
jgi:hypothetical protein